MITKNPATRINDVLATIGGTPHFPATERARVHAFASGYIGGTYPPANASTAGYKAFSDQMTMTDVRQAGSSDERAMRRAIFLLWRAMGDAMEAAKAKMILSADVQAAFVATMQKALCFSDTAAGNPAGTKYVFKDVFRANPLPFLQRNKIMVAGVSAFNAATTQNILRFMMQFDAGRDRYYFSNVSGTVVAGGRYAFDTTSVPAVYWADVPGRTAVVGTGSFAAIRGTQFSGKYMVTTQFTGCAFCLKDTGGGLFAAHVSPSYKGATRTTPTPGIDAKLLAEQLCGTSPPVVGGNFSNAPAGANPFRVFGKGHSNIPGQAGYDGRCAAGGGANWMTLFGFNNNGAWEIYAQEIINNAINSAYRIW
jgi:hypothetical protein